MNNRILITKNGTNYINKQLKGPGLSLMGFVPFLCNEDVFNGNSTKSEFIADALGSIYNYYYFNGLEYKIDTTFNVVPINKDDEYKDLFDLVTDDRLYNIKYTNTKNIANEDISLYNFHLDIDDIKVDLNENTPSVNVNAIAIFIESNVAKEHANQNSIELFGIIYFENSIDLVKDDINWTLFFNSKGEVNTELVSEEILDAFGTLDNTEKSNVYSSTQFDITNTPYTFSDTYHDNAKTLFYSDGWSLGFVKGDLNDYNYDLTLINDSGHEDGYFFNINPNTNSLEMQNTNRDANIMFGSYSDIFGGKGSLLLKSPVSDANSYGVFAINSSGRNQDNSKNIFLYNSDSYVSNSNNVSMFGKSNSVNSSDNAFINGDRNYTQFNNIFIVGNGNNASSNNSYIFGNSNNNVVDTSIVLGSSYTNYDYSFVYTNNGAIYGLEKDYGNFVIEDKTNGHNGKNVQFSKNSVYLMDSFKQINPKSANESLLINNSNVSADNSFIFGEYATFNNSHIINSISVGSSYNMPGNMSRTRANSIVENSFDLSNKLYNVNANNSLLIGDVSSKDGIVIENSYVNDTSATNGMINNSLILNSNVSGKYNVHQSLILTNSSKSITNSTIQNSIIQGNTNNSTFKNAHLIGNLPNGVNKEFEDCLVIADGVDYVEIHADCVIKKINGQFETIPLKYGLVDVFMNEEWARGEEWKRDFDQTYEEKILDLLSNQSVYCKKTSSDSLMFAGELGQGKTKCMCSMYVINDYMDFTIYFYFDLTAKKVIYDVYNVTLKKIISSQTNDYRVSTLSQIVNKLEFVYDGNKIYIKNIKFGDAFCIYRLCTCSILDEDTHTGGTKFSVEEVEKTLSVEDLYMNSQGNKVNYNLRNIEVETNTANFLTTDTNELNIKNYEVYDNTNLKNSLYYAPIALKNEDVFSYSSFGWLLHSAIKPTIYFQNDKNYVFDGVFSACYTYNYLTDKVEKQVNKDPLIKAYDNRNKVGLISIEEGIPVESNTKFNDYYIHDLLIDGYDDDSYIDYDNSENMYKINFKKLKNYGHNFYSFIRDDSMPKDFLKDVDTSKFAIYPIFTYKDYISGTDKLFNFTNLLVWGKMVNMSIFTSNFDKVKEDGEDVLFVYDKYNQMPIFAVHKDLKPLMDIESYVEFANFNELYPFNTASYRISRDSGKCYLNLHVKPELISIVKFAKKGADNLTELYRYYNNVFMRTNGEIGQKGLIRQDITYIANMPKSLNKSEFKNDFYNKYKGHIENYGGAYILRTGEYYYT